MALPISGNCHYHPMRPGIGICVECRQVVCSECSTPFEGINRCARCLSRLSQQARSAPRESDWRPLPILAALGVFGALFGVFAAAAALVAP
jgi:hypothetical protein